MYNKQQCAFMWSAERLHGSTGHLYFWTFTFKDCHDLWKYGRLWKNFTRDLERLCSDPALWGIRVCQLHPGGHGLHYHCLLNCYLDARKVWGLCFKHRMGCDVRKVQQKNWQDAVKYLCRYMTRDAEPFPIRIRRVGSMFGFPMYPKNDVKYEHPASDSISYLIKFLPRGSIGRDFIGACYESPNCRGDYRTLLVALDYNNMRRFQSLQWTEETCQNALMMSPYRDWVNYEDTIYNPTWMPLLLGDNPF